MTRYCASCQRDRPLRDFDLGGPARSTTCVECVENGVKISDQSRATQLKILENERRSHIAALVQIDAKIAEIRGRPSSSISSSFERVESSDVFDVPDGDFSGD